MHNDVVPRCAGADNSRLDRGRIGDFVIAVALLGQQQIEIFDLRVLCFQGGKCPIELVLDGS
jgi:hypothetical protein